jgi:hypothetical protein
MAPLTLIVELTCFFIMKIDSRSLEKLMAFTFSCQVHKKGLHPTSLNYKIVSNSDRSYRWALRFHQIAIVEI